MEIEFENLGSLKKRITAKIPKEKVKLYYESELAKIKNSYTPKGFRKGKVPRSQIIKRFGKELEEETVHKIINATFNDALGQEKQSIAFHYSEGAPYENFHPEEDFAYHMDYDVLSPEIDPGVYKKYLFEKKEIEILPEEIEQQKVTQFPEFYEKIPKEGTIEKGDYVSFEKHFPEKTPEAVANNPKTDFKVGYKFLPELKSKGEEFIGMKTGDRLPVKNSPPENDAAVEETQISFDAEIKEIYSMKPLPVELEAIKRIYPNVENVDGLDEAVREHLDRSKRSDRLDDLFKELEEKLEKDLNFEVSEGLLNEEKERIRNNIQSKYPDGEGEDHSEKRKAEEEAAFKKALAKIRLHQFLATMIEKSPLEGFDHRLQMKLQILDQLGGQNNNGEVPDFIRHYSRLIREAHFIKEGLSIIMVDLLGRDVAPDLDEYPAASENGSENSGDAANPGETENPETAPAST